MPEGEVSLAGCLSCGSGDALDERQACHRRSAGPGWLLEVLEVCCFANAAPGKEARVVSVRKEVGAAVWPGARTLVHAALALASRGHCRVSLSAGALLARCFWKSRVWPSGSGDPGFSLSVTLSSSFSKSPFLHPPFPSHKVVTKIPRDTVGEFLEP